VRNEWKHLTNIAILIFRMKFSLVRMN